MGYDFRDERLSARVARRFLESKAFGGDLKGRLVEWKKLLDYWVTWENEIPRIAQELLAGTEQKYEKGKITSYSFTEFVTGSFHKLRRIGVRDLFLALLQQYELPAHARPEIEEAARFFARTGVRNPRTFKTAVPAYRKALAYYQKLYNIVEDVVAAGQSRSTEDNGVSVLSAGPFKVVNTGGFDTETMRTAVEVVKRATQLLQAKGLGKVCYGDVLMSQQIAKSNILAFYRGDADEMFIRADLKGSEHDALETVIHELGHRLHRQFLKHKDRHISLMHGKIKRGRKGQQEAAIEEIVNDPRNWPKVGDEVESPDKYKYVVSAFDPKDKLVTIRLVENPSVYSVVLLWPILKWQGHKTPEVKASAFVTSYASTKPSENFAEMIRFYCLDKLPADQVKMLEAILA